MLEIWQAHIFFFLRLVFKKNLTHVILMPFFLWQQRSLPLVMTELSCQQEVDGILLYLSVTFMLTGFCAHAASVKGHSS